MAFLAREGTARPRAKVAFGAVGDSSREGTGAEAALLSNGPTLPPTPQPGGKAALRGQGMGVSHEGWARLLSAVNLHKAFDVGGSDW